jgi:hypothetical protein
LRTRWVNGMGGPGTEYRGMYSEQLGGRTAMVRIPKTGQGVRNPAHIGAWRSFDRCRKLAAFARLRAQVELTDHMPGIFVSTVSEARLCTAIL